MNLGEQLCPWLEAPLAELMKAKDADRLGHAWLIAGSAGSGKLNLALVLAGRLLEGTKGRPVEPATPSSIVAAMRDRYLPSNHHPDLHLVFPEEDKRTISVDQIRDVSESLNLTGLKGTAKVVVIEPAEAMTLSAANALLKLLEEPTRDTYLLLVAHRPGRLASTIRSRCQTLIVRPPSESALSEWLGSDGDGGRASAREVVAPLLAAARRDNEYDLFINELNANIQAISEERADPVLVADRWLKQDLGLILEWLVGRIHRTIRARIGAKASNPVTDRPRGLGHNDWQQMRLAQLFEQLRGAQALQDRLGGGTNAELQLRVLLLGFSPDRGRR